MKTSTTSCATNGDKQTRTSLIDGAAIKSVPQFLYLMSRRAKQSFSLVTMILVLMLGFARQSFSQSQTFTSNGTFVVPAGVTSVNVQAWGGGGAGGGGTSTNTRGGGGGGGAYVMSTGVLVNSGASYSITVGTGGNGGTGAGPNGNTSSAILGSTVSANGGTGGALGNPGAGGAGGTGGTYAGGAGVIGGSANGGGGGGSAGTGSDGNAATSATGATAVTGGGPGGNGATANGNGSAPATGPGGGGGGAYRTSTGSRSGGNGANGQVIISWTCSIYELTLPASTTLGCGGGPSTITLNSTEAGLPVGNYTVTYDLTGNNIAIGSTASMTVSTPGTGNFTTSSLVNPGSTIVTITKLASGLCSNNIISNGNNAVEVTVNPIPATPGIPTSDGPKCSGTNVTLTANGTPPDGEIWYWQTSATGTSTANSGSTFTVTTAGTTFIRSQNTTSLCWSAAASIAVTFNALPPSRNVTGGTTICSGNSTNISVASSTNGTTTYQLRDNLNNPIGSPVTGTGGTITLPTGPLTGTMTFNVLATITATGCTAQMSNTPTVTVNQQPTATGGGGSQPICVNGSATVSGITASNGTISWAISNGGGTLSNGTTSSPIYTPVAADAGKAVLLTMTVTNSPCAAATATYTVNVEGLPTATAGGSQTICYNGAATVSDASASNGTISWSTSGGGSLINAGTPSPTYNSVAADAGQAIILTMTVTGNNSCGPLTATATYTVNVGAVPVPTIICAGGNGTLTSSISCPAGSTLTAGPKNPGAGANGGGSNTAWTTPGNILADDNNAATAGLSILNTTSQNLNATGFSFAIPSNAIINGILVSINRWANNTTSAITDNIVSLLKAGSVIGDNKKSSTAWVTANTTIVTYGGATDKWGTTWSPTDINNANFGVSLAVVAAGLANTANVNYIQISVNYTTPDGVVYWYNEVSDVTPIGSGTTFNPVGATNSKLQNTNTAGKYTFYSECSTNPVCRTATDFIIKVMPETPTAGNNGPVCVGEGITLTASSITNATYAWTGPQGFTSDKQNPTVSTSATTDLAGIYKVKATIDGCTSAEGTTTVIVNFVPTQPDAIEGSATPCSGTSQIYSVTNVPSVSYSWVFPSGWTTTGPTNLNSITVLTGTVSGEISVTPSTPCGPGTAQTLEVNLTSGLPPDQPGPISGSATPCEGSSQTYSVENVDGVSYIWTFPTGWTQTAGDHTSSVIVTVGTGTGLVQVTPANTCSIGTAQTLSVNPVLIPLQPGPISGLTSPNQGFSQVYSVPFVSSGITYDWVFPTGWTQTSGQTTNSVTVTVGSASGIITVTPHTCVSGQPQTLSVSPIQGSSDATITPLTSSICLGSSVNLSGSSTIPISPVTITTGTDNFNGTSTYASAGSNTGGGVAWTKEVSGFSATLVTTWTPPDASSFMLTYTAAFGTATTNSTLTSPIINTTGYTPPFSLGFQHTYAQGTSGSGKVEVSIDGGTTWLATPLATYNSVQGTGAAFATVSLDMSAYVNQSNLRIRFNYSSSVSLANSWWGIDNVTLSGAPVPLFSWIASPSSTSGLPVGAGTPSASNDHISVNPTQTTSYIVTATNPLTNATANSSPATVTVNPVPDQPSIKPGGPTTFCAGGKVTLTSSPEATYLWSPGGATTQSIDVTASGSYTVQVTNAAGCPSVPSAATIVTVNPLPVATISAGGPTTFCQGGSVVLTSSLGSSYSWSTGETSSSITVNSSGSYTVQVTDAAGCFATSAPTVVTVNALPAQPTITAEGPTTFCIGGSVTLTANAASSYAWSPGGGISQSITVTTPGDYTVQVTNAAGCLSVPSAATTVTVNSLPDAPAILTGEPLEFCFGGKVTLTSTSGSGYLWSNGALTQSIDATESGSYTVSVTDANGCQSLPSLAAVVTVNPLPTAHAWTDTPSLCEGFPLSLFASGGTSYSWTGPNSFASNEQNPSIESVVSASAGDYIVTVTDDNTHCFTTASFTLNVVKQDPFSVSSDSPVCEGTTLHLYSSGGDIFSWTGPGITLDNSTQQNPTVPNVTLSEAGTYTVTIINTLCGQSELSTLVKVIAMPAAPTASNNTITYDGSPHTATASVSENNVVIDWYANSSGPTTASEPTGTNANTYIAYAEARNTVTKCINPFRTQVTLAIGKRPITITVDPNQTKSCKENDPLAFSYSVGGDNLASGDVFSGKLHRLPGEAVGSYAIDMSTLTIMRGSTDNLFNYQVTFNPDVFTITDIIPPVITAPANIDQETDLGLCVATVTIIPATVTDNCGVGLALGTRSDGKLLTDKYPIGPTTITWSVTDYNGNTGESKDQIITISDKEKPVIHVSNINKPADAGICEAALTITATATDNCGVGDPSGTRNDGLALNAPYPVGITTITWTVTDIHSNTSTVNQTITVVDDVKPTVFAHPFTLNLDQFGHATLKPSDIDAQSFDNCAIVKFGLSQTDFDCSNVGDNDVFLFAADKSLNSGVAMTTVTVKDVTPPVAKAKDITVQLDATGNVTITPAQVDNGSSDACQISLSLDKFSFTCADIGPNTVTLTVTDQGMNPSTATATVTVQDNLAPVLTGAKYAGVKNIDACKANAAAAAPFSATDAITGYSDNCNGIITAALTGTEVTGTDCDWTVTYTFTVTDAHNNDLTGQTYSNIGGDKTAPTLTGSPYAGLKNVDACMSNIENAAPFVPADAITGYSDNCSGTVTATLTNTEVTGTDCNWTVTYTFSVADACGNTLMAQTYSNSGGDKTAPALTGSKYAGLKDINVCMANAATAAPFNATDAITGFTDNCGGTVTATLTGTDVSGTDCNWSITYTFTVTDGCGNVLADQTYSNSGGDKTAPTLTGTAYTGITNVNGCMASASTAAPFSATDAIMGYTDNCSGTVTATLTGTEVTGTECNWTVTYTFTVADACGNELKGQTYSNSGSDRTAPALTGTAYAGLKGVNACMANADIAAPFIPADAITGYTDNCGGTVTATLTGTEVTGTNCDWSVKYTFTVADGCGNTLADQTYSNSGGDKTAPTLTGTAYTGLTNVSGCKANAATLAPFNATDAIMGYSDNCGGAVTATLTGTEVSGTDCNWTVTYTFSVIDGCGNELIGQTYSNSGKDETAPTLTGSPYAGLKNVDACMSNIENAAPFVPADAITGYSDNCSGTVTATLTNTEVTGTDCNWTVTYTFSVADACGNTLMAQTYSNSGGDKTAPALTGSKYAGLKDINVCMANAATAAPFNATDAITGFTDNCGGAVTATLTGTDVTGTDCSWMVTYTFSVTDGCGNVLADQTYSNSGGDKTAPTLTGTAYTGITNADGCMASASTAAPFSATDAIMGYTDNCSGTVKATLTGTEVTGTECNWTVTYTFTVADACGNELKGQTYSNSGSDKTAPALTGTAYAGLKGVNACMANAETAAPFIPADALTGYTDNCGGTVTATLTGTEVTGTNCNWSVKYTFTVTDGCGNTLAGQTYSNSGGDKTAPTLTGSAYTGLTNVSGCKANAATVAPFNATDAITGYSDNCGGAVTATLTGTEMTGTDCSWTVIYTFTVTDGCGNGLISQTYSNSGGDKTAPALTGAAYAGLKGVNACKVNAETAAPFNAANAITGFSDNCSGTVTASLTGTEVTGTDCNWIVTYTFSVADGCGNVLTGQTYSNSGGDKTAPTLTGAAYSGIKDVNVCMANAATAAPFSASNAVTGYSDNCGGTVTATLTGTQVTGTNCNWTVFYTFTVADACGNELIGQTYSNSGGDKTAPTAIAQNVTVNLDASGNAAVTPQMVNNGSSDNCGTVTLSLDKTIFTCAEVGNNNVTLTVTDACSYSASATAIVKVVDNTPPTVLTQNVTVALDGTGHATVTAAQINNGSNDACGIKSMSLSKTDFTSADVINPNVVTLSVTDNNGNVGTGTATVTVTAIQISVVALPQTKVYGDPDPELKYTFTPALLGNDSFTGTLSRAAGNSVNTYAINQGTLALPGYYKINFTKADFTITPRPVTVRADAQSKQWGTSDPALTYQVTSGTLVYNESCEGSLTRDPGEDVGVYQIRQGTLHLSSNYTLKYEGNTFTITQKSMLPSVTVSPATIQYSDEVTFTARITLGAPLLSGRLHPSASVTFKIGAQDMGTVQMRVKGLDLEGKLTTTLSERIKGQMAPGNKVVYAVFSFSDRKMTVSPNPATSNLMITQEDARVTVTGTYIQSTNSFGKSFDDGKILLKATIQDITACRGDQDYDPNAGDIRNARVRFMKGTTPITNWLIPDLVNGRDTKTGVVNAKWSYDGASRDVPSDIRVEVGGEGYYVRNDPADLSVVTLYSPAGDYVAGGGYLSNPNNSDGSCHGTPGLRTNFGFVVKYTNKGTNPQGKMDFIFRRLIDGQVHTYQINSTSITYVAVNDVFRCGKNALITAKANLNEITNPGMPLLMGSNLKLLVRMSDYGENTSGDRIAISLWNGFSLLFSSNWNGLLTTQTQLGDGNLIIHSGFNFGDIFNGQVDDGQENLLTSEIGVKAYPNPFTDHVYFDLSLPTDSKVRLEIYNVDGSKVATLYDDVVVAYDHYRLEFAPNKLSSNILIYRLIVDGKLEFTGKLIHK